VATNRGLLIPQAKFAKGRRVSTTSTISGWPVIYQIIDLLGNGLFGFEPRRDGSVKTWRGNGGNGKWAAAASH